MQINPVSNQSFESNTFRLPLKEIKTRWWSKKVDCEKVYDNPIAEQLYKKAQQTTDLREKADLLYQMGYYRIVNKEHENRIKRFLTTILP